VFRLVWQSQLTRFVIVGGLNLFLANFFFLILYTLLKNDVDYLALYILATVLFLPVCHKMQRRLVWRSTGKYFQELYRFALVNFPGIALTYLLASSLVSHDLFPVIQAQVITSSLVAVGLYLIHRVWTFSY